MSLGSGIRDPGFGIRNKPIPDPGSRGQKGTGSRIRIRNTAKKSQNSRNQGFPYIFFLLIEGLDPGGPKTCGSGTLLRAIINSITGNNFCLEP
jgi:hypothetical protein